MEVVPCGPSRAPDPCDELSRLYSRPVADEEGCCSVRTGSKVLRMGDDYRLSISAHPAGVHYFPSPAATMPVPSSSYVQPGVEDPPASGTGSYAIRIRWISAHDGPSEHPRRRVRVDDLADTLALDLTFGADAVDSRGLCSGQEYFGACLSTESSLRRFAARTACVGAVLIGEFSGQCHFCQPSRNIPSWFGILRTVPSLR